MVDRRSGLVVDVDRQLDQRAGRHHPLGRIGAERAAGVGDAVADREAVHTVADSLDDARCFDAHAVGQRHRIIAEAEIGVGEVQPDGDVANADLARAGLADLNLFVAQHFGPARFIEAYGVRHQNSPLIRENSGLRPRRLAFCIIHDRFCLAGDRSRHGTGQGGRAHRLFRGRGSTSARHRPAASAKRADAGNAGQSRADATGASGHPIAGGKRGGVRLLDLRPQDGGAARTCRPRYGQPADRPPVDSARRPVGADPVPQPHQFHPGCQLRGIRRHGADCASISRSTRPCPLARPTTWPWACSTRCAAACLAPTGSRSRSACPMSHPRPANVQSISGFSPARSSSIPNMREYC